MSTRKSASPRKVASRTSTAKRPRFRLGPATLLAMCAAIVIAYVQWPQWQRDKAASHALDEQRAAIAKRGVQKPRALLSIETILQQRDSLHLSSVQIASLQKIQQQFNRESAPLQKLIEQKASVFQDWTHQAQTRGGVTMTEIQTHSADYSAASAQLAAQRRLVLQRALAVLNDAQRQQFQRTSNP